MTKWILTVALVLSASTIAHAQYRAPPPTEAQAYARDAETERTDAAKQLSSGDRSGAMTTYKKAIELYKKALKSDPEIASAAVGLGDACLASKDYATAIAILGPFHTTHPDNDDVSFFLGVALFKAGKYNDALPLLDVVSRINKPEHFLAHYYRGGYALQQSDGDKALEELTLYLKSRPAELASDDFQIHEFLGRAHILRHKPADARRELDAAQKGRPEIFSIQLELENVLEMEGRMPDAIKALDTLSKKYPNRPELLERIAYLHLLQKDYVHAAQYAQNAIKLQKTDHAYTLLGDIKYAQKDWAGAEGAYRDGLKIAPDYVLAMIGLGKTLQQRGKNDEALALLEKGANSRSTDLALWAALGSAYRRAGRYQKAVEAHSTILKLAPQNPQGPILVGADHFATGSWDEAISDYGAALKLDAQNERARHWLATSLLRRVQSQVGTKQFENNALFDLKRAFDLEPTGTNAQALGAALLGAKQNTEARNILSGASNKPDATWQLDLLLGYAAMGDNDPTAAVAAFEKAAKLTHDPAAENEIYLGWALAKISLGEYEAAVGKLQAGAQSDAVNKVMQANLPVALLKLGFKQLQDGDVAGAQKNLTAALASPATKKGAIGNIAELLRGLIAVENKQYGPATSDVHAALKAQASWFEPVTRPLLEAYLEYRKGHPALARKPLALAMKNQAAAKLPWTAQLAKAINLLDAEQLYAAGQVPRAEPLFKSLAANDQLNAQLKHDLACVTYRKSGVPAAEEAWKGTADAVCDSNANLGMLYQDKKRDQKAAIEYYRKYLQCNGSHSHEVQEWLNRLISIYGEDVVGSR